MLLIALFSMFINIIYVMVGIARKSLRVKIMTAITAFTSELIGYFLLPFFKPLLYYNLRCNRNTPIRGFYYCEMTVFIGVIIFLSSRNLYSFYSSFLIIVNLNIIYSIILFDWYGDLHSVGIQWYCQPEFHILSSLGDSWFPRYCSTDVWHILFAGFKIIEEAVRRLWNQSLMDVRGFIVNYKRGSPGVTLSLGLSVISGIPL